MSARQRPGGFVAEDCYIVTVDLKDHTCYGLNPQESTVMALWQSRTGRLRTPRGIAAVLIVVAYLFAGFSHGLCDLDVANPGGAAVVSVPLDEGGDAADKGALAGHHCHGCFSVAMPAMAQAPQQDDLPVSKWRPPLPQLTGQAPGTDTPPPKYLA